MRNKRTVIRLDKNHSQPKRDMFIQELVKSITSQKDLEERDVMESITRLEKLGVIVKEEVSIH